MAMTAKSKAVFNYVLENDGEDFTLNDIAEALDMTSRGVNGCLVAMQRKDPALIVREEKEIKLADGTHEKVKFIRITEAGKKFDPDYTEPKDED